MTSVSFGELAGKYVRGNHGKREALSGQQRHAKRGVAYQCDTASRPTIHFYLADAVEIDFRRSLQLGENVRTFPLTFPIPLPQHCLLQVKPFWQHIVGGEHEQKQRPIVMQCKAAKHSIWHSVHQINILIARTVAADLERGDGVSETCFQPDFAARTRACERRSAGRQRRRPAQTAELPHS